MSQTNESGLYDFEADEAIEVYRRVKLDADGKVTKAGLTDRGIGSATRPAYAAGDRITIALDSKPGTMKCVASEAITVGSTVYSEADGKVQDTAQATAYPVGIALHSVTGDDSVVEIMPRADETAAS